MNQQQFQNLVHAAVDDAIENTGMASKRPVMALDNGGNTYEITGFKFDKDNLTFFVELD